MELGGERGYLEWAFRFETEVFELNGCKLGKLDTGFRKMQSSNLFIEDFRKHGNANRPSLLCSPKFNLRKNLIRERSRHDKRRMSSSTTQIDKSSLGKQNNMISIRQ